MNNHILDKTCPIVMGQVSQRTGHFIIWICQVTG